MSSFNCCIFTCIQISQRSFKVLWYSHLYKNFSQFVVIHIVKGFSIISEAKIDVFLELYAFSVIQQMLAIWFLIPMPFLNPDWQFLVYKLLKPNLENTEHYFTSVWDEHNCAVVWAFFGNAFLWDWNETDLFQSCGCCWVFQICWHIKCSTFTASSFRIWSRSAGISSPPLALFIVMLPKAHLTLHYRMSGSQWVITPWLSGSLRSFLCSSPVYSCHLLLISSVSVRSISFLSFVVSTLCEMFPWYL